MTALLLLMPGTPMLFQGQEFSASAPFLYFVTSSPSWRTGSEKPPGIPGAIRQLPGFLPAAEPADPGALETFERCILDFNERRTHADAYALHRDLLRREVGLLI